MEKSIFSMNHKCRFILEFALSQSRILHPLLHSLKLLIEALNSSFQIKHLTLPLGPSLNKSYGPSQTDYIGSYMQTVLKNEF